jgi:3-hydroxyisobutyrate dehydrogenase
MRIGIAGVGRMGSNMALRLMEGGDELTIWNRSTDKLKLLAAKGASVTKTPAQLAGAAEAIITIVTDSSAIDAVYHGPQGLLSAEVQGKLFIEMSTLPPGITQTLAEKVRGKGAAFVECPVAGSTAPARTGKLLGLVGAWGRRRKLESRRVLLREIQLGQHRVGRDGSRSGADQYGVLS